MCLKKMEMLVFIQYHRRREGGHALLLVHELDYRVKKYIKEARKVGIPIDTTVVMASGEAVVRKTDKYLLKEKRTVDQLMLRSLGPNHF